jgi:hypothetical protein
VNPPLLVPSIPENPLILYLTVNETTMGSVLGQHDDMGRKEQVIYYISKKFTDCETHYNMIKKLCYGLAWNANILHHYMLYYTTWLIFKIDPLKYIFEKPYFSSRIARWQVLLSKNDIVYMTKKAVKKASLLIIWLRTPLRNMNLWALTSQMKMSW